MRSAKGKSRLLAVISAAALLGASNAGHSQTGSGNRAGCPMGVQATATPFEVASVRRVPRSREGYTNVTYGKTNRFTATNISLQNLIAIAYSLDSSRIESRNGWLETNLYDVSAKAEGGQVENIEQLRPMLQQLLQERFHLACHFETREVSGYSLVTAPGGAKLKLSNREDGGGSIYRGGIQGASISMKTLASMLERPAGRPISDQTGLQGTFQIKLSYAPDDAPDSSLPNFFTALQEQLGLVLKRGKVPLQVMVLDHADENPMEN